MCTEYDVSEEIHQFCTVKLIIQPILENAIYYGVGNMDADDNPRILVKGWRTDNDIYLAVSDNGMGMRQEDVKNILSDNKKVPKHGSGVGLIACTHAHPADVRREVRSYCRERA